MTSIVIYCVFMCMILDMSVVRLKKSKMIKFGREREEEYRKLK